MTITAFPLTWPAHKPRTARHRVERSAFDRDRSMDRARRMLENEVRLLGGTGLIISTNIALRLDGLPRSGQRAPDDAGVAIYFKRKAVDMAFACDRWDRVEDNLYAIAKTIDALRGVARWGTGDMMQAAFTGFAALPPPIVAGMTRDWQAVLELQDLLLPTRDDIEKAYRRLASQNHPDKGGSTARMAEINQARAAGLAAT